jgi:hypothetical protein
MGCVPGGVAVIWIAASLRPVRVGQCTGFLDFSAVVPIVEACDTPGAAFRPTGRVGGATIIRFGAKVTPSGSAVSRVGDSGVPQALNARLQRRLIGAKVLLRPVDY